VISALAALQDVKVVALRSVSGTPAGVSHADRQLHDVDVDLSLVPRAAEEEEVGGFVTGLVDDRGAHELRTLEHGRGKIDRYGAAATRAALRLPAKSATDSAPWSSFCTLSLKCSRRRASWSA